MALRPRILVEQGLSPASADGAPGLATSTDLGQAIALDAAALHHLAVVLRCRAGAEIELFDGRGHAAPAVLEDMSSASAAIGAPVQRAAQRGSGTANGPRRGKLSRSGPARFQARLTGAIRVEPAPALRIGLAQAISTGDRMDWTIEKAVEAGVFRIVPLQSARSTQRVNAEGVARRHQHWRRIIAAASAQCGRNWLTLLEPAQTPTEFLDNFAPAVRPPERAAGLLLLPTAQQSLTAVLATGDAGQQPPAAVWIACGPEAGFSPEEARTFVNQGWQPVHLGPRTLRTETAALVAVAIIQSRWGDLG